MKKKFTGITNIDVKEVPLNLSPKGHVHTNPDGSKVTVKKIGAEYFEKRVKGLQTTKSKGGSSGLFPNHLEFNGWLHFNNLAAVDIDEIDEKWT